MHTEYHSLRAYWRLLSVTGTFIGQPALIRFPHCHQRMPRSNFSRVVYSHNAIGHCFTWVPSWESPQALYRLHHYCYNSILILTSLAYYIKVNIYWVDEGEPTISWPLTRSLMPDMAMLPPALYTDIEPRAAFSFSFQSLIHANGAPSLRSWVTATTHIEFSYFIIIDNSFQSCHTISMQNVFIFEKRSFPLHLCHVRGFRRSSTLNRSIKPVVSLPYYTLKKDIEWPVNFPDSALPYYHF